MGNADYGVELAYDASGDSRQVTSTSANTIGGTIPALPMSSQATRLAASRLPAPATDNVVAGDFIGTDITGTVAIANGTGVEIASGASADTIGGTTASARDIISANDGSGVENRDAANDNLVEG